MKFRKKLKITPEMPRVSKLKFLRLTMSLRNPFYVMLSKSIFVRLLNKRKVLSKRKLMILMLR